MNSYVSLYVVVSDYVSFPSNLMTFVCLSLDYLQYTVDFGLLVVHLAFLWMSSSSLSLVSDCDIDVDVSISSSDVPSFNVSALAYCPAFELTSSFFYASHHALCSYARGQCSVSLLSLCMSVANSFCFCQSFLTLISS